MSASQRFERYMEHLAAGLWPVGGAEDAQDTERRQKAGVPAEVKFATKNEIALQQLETLLAEGAPKYCMLSYAGYGVDQASRGNNKFVTRPVIWLEILQSPSALADVSYWKRGSLQFHRRRFPV